MKQKKFDCNGRCLEELLNYSSCFFMSSKKKYWFWGLQKLYCKALMKWQKKIQDCRNREEKNVEENLLIMPDN